MPANGYQGRYTAFLMPLLSCGIGFGLQNRDLVKEIGIFRPVFDILRCGRSANPASLAIAVQDRLAQSSRLWPLGVLVPEVVLMQIAHQNF